MERGNGRTDLAFIQNLKTIPTSPTGTAHEADEHSHALGLIDAEELVLPAMQRPFVWEKDRIRRLMDSLMRGFPIGTVLIWETDKAQRFRLFTRDYSSDSQSLVNFPEAKTKRLQFVLDGQQRLTSLSIATRGSLDGSWLYFDLLSGDQYDPERDSRRDPGEMYFDFQFLTGPEAAELNKLDAEGKPEHLFKPFREFLSLGFSQATSQANDLAQKCNLTKAQADRVVKNFAGAVEALQIPNPLQVFVIDQHGQSSTPIEEILELFVRINSGGLSLQKSDLLMSLLDMKWNDIQPELIEVARKANEISPFEVTRDLVLKTSLLLTGQDTRFDKLVQNRHHVEQLASKLQETIPHVQEAWLRLASILKSKCKIHSPRFFRQATNALLPFAAYLANQPDVGQAEENRIVAGIYLTLMSGVFGGAEARMGKYAREHCLENDKFPLAELVRLVQKHTPVRDLDSLLGNQRDLALNIAQGGVVADNNPDELERDHIFPRALLAKLGISADRADHYANFHFLRLKDNRNKTDKPPHMWFASPGPKAAAYSDEDLAALLIERDEIQEGKFDLLIERRGARIRNAACEMFHTTEEKFNALFEQG